jgi:hypothetical protein
VTEPSAKHTAQHSAVYSTAASVTNSTAEKWAQQRIAAAQYLSSSPSVGQHERILLHQVLGETSTGGI